MAIKDKAHRRVQHSFENCPPHQEKYDRGGPGGDNDWNLKSTACPVDSPKINTMANSSSVEELSHERTVMYPAIIDGHSSPNIFNSRTDGKGRKL